MYFVCGCVCAAIPHGKAHAATFMDRVLRTPAVPYNLSVQKHTHTRPLAFCQYSIASPVYISAVHVQGCLGGWSSAELPQIPH